MKLALAVALSAASILASAAPAAAQPGETAPITAYPPPPPTPVPVAGGQSEQVALGLSLVGTAVPWAMVLGAHMVTDDPNTYEGLMLLGTLGTFVGPSAGHWYGGTIFTRGMGVRAIGTGVGFAGLVTMLAQCPLFSDEPCDPTLGILMFVGGGVLYAAGTIDDIVSAPRRIRRNNERRAGFAIAPVVTHQSAGLALGGTF